MFKKSLQISVISLAIFGLTGCHKRTITVHPGETSTQRRVVVPITHEPQVQEEILLGRNGRTGKNPSLGRRVSVPRNNPSIGESASNSGETPGTEDDEQTPIEDKFIERMPFPVEEYSHVKKRGSSTVSGRIYLENSYNSEKVPGKKLKLWLNPVTSYSRQWYEESYLGGYKLSKTDSRLYNYLKFTYSNADGNFNFYGVPAGDYYLTGTMPCGEECGFSERKSVRLVKEISVGRGTTKVDLMKNVP